MICTIKRWRKDYVKKILLKIKNFNKKYYIDYSVSMHKTKLSDYCFLAHHSEIQNSIIGKRTSIGRYTKIRDANIGSYCSISWNVTIGAPSHPMTRITSHAFTYRKQFGLVSKNENLETKITTIGNDVWIGCNAVIMSGVTIGNGAIIGAGAIVTKNVEPYSIVAGVPAKKIRNRFENIDEINEIEWWNLDDEIIKQNIELFKWDLNNNVINKIKQLQKKEG